MKTTSALVVLGIGCASLVATTASAADLPRKRQRVAVPVAQVAPIPMNYNWTGPYAGVQAGGRWGAQNSSGKGIVGGAHIGYNAQVNDSIVVGVEGDIEGSGYDGNRTIGGVGINSKSQLQGSVRARAGVLATDRTLIYATAGGAAANFKNSYGSPLGAESISTTKMGWTAGAGIEHAATDNMRLRIEYRYTDYGKINHVSSVAAPGTSFSTPTADHSLRAGVSMRF